jgi:site-specific DNA-cytosine methylase
MDAIPHAAAILAAAINIRNGECRLDSVPVTLSRRPGGSDIGSQMNAVLSGRPRRLTPLECERLMGWPDGWTDVPDEKGKPASDSVRYKACGNGVATPVAHWIALRLRQTIEGVRDDA